MRRQLNSKPTRREVAELALVTALMGLQSCHASSSAPEQLPRPEREATASLACGAPGQPECPTQRWMKSTLQAYLRTRDYKRLERSLEELATHTPDGFRDWEEIARRGSRAAGASDEALVRKSCKECHDQHREQFRQQSRGIELL